MPERALPRSVVIRAWTVTLLTASLCGLPAVAGSAADAVDSSRAASFASSGWPDSGVARLEASLLLQTLNAELLSHDSATETLERWCSVHRLAPSARIVAERVAGMDKPVTPDQRRELSVSDLEPVRYRRVRLVCGSLVLSEADNWYVPARLTPAMNQVLDTTDTPFGRVVRELHFHRHTLSAKLLTRLLPEGWEMVPGTPAHGAGSSPALPSGSQSARPSGVARPLKPAEAAPAGRLPLSPQVLEHRALLMLPDGTPLSEVIETYSANVLAFPYPACPSGCSP